MDPFLDNTFKNMQTTNDGESLQLNLWKQVLSSDLNCALVGFSQQKMPCQ